MDPLLLTLGAIRVLLWALGARDAWLDRRAALCAGMTLAATGAVVFAVTNAGGRMPQWTFDAATVIATPAVALIVGSKIADRRSRPPYQGPWRP